MVGLLAWLLASPILPPPAPGTLDRHVQRAAEAAGVGDAACTGCHTEATRSTRAGDRLAPVPSPLLAGPALIFSHQRHLERGSTCADCHRAGGAQPAEADCARCHDVRDTQACAGCHPAATDGRLVTRTPFGNLRPALHGVDFTRDHGPGARQAPESCETCHTPPDCQRCHAGRVRPISLHPGDFIATHGPPARRNDPDCSTCHRLQTFCVGCHAQSGLTLAAPNRGFGAESRDRVRFHPEGFGGNLGGVPGPEHHRVAARRNLSECVSCHQESDCIRCHSTEATQRLRSNPHPADFAQHCRPLLEANSRGCVKCHTSGPPLEARCR